MKKSKKILAFAGIAAVAASVTASAASVALGEYFQSVVGLVPNKLEISAYEQVRYNDNINNASSDETDSVVFKTGINLDIYRMRGDMRYGVNGDFGYEYYTHEQHDHNQFTWNISPFIMGNIADIQNLKISFNSKAKIEPVSRFDTRRARSYDNGVSLVYDYTRHERYGFALTGDYDYLYYPQKEFRGYTKQSYGVSLAPYYKLSDKIRLGVRSSYVRTDYAHDELHDDSDELTINGFVDYHMNQFVSAYAEAGTSQRFYEGDSKNSNGDREWMPDFLVGLKYQPTKHWTYNLSTSLAPKDTNSVARGDSMNWATIFTVAWKPVTKFALTNEVGISVEDEKNSEFDTREVFYSARADYAFSNKLSVYTQYKYNNIQFPYESSRDYAINEVIAGVRYKF